MGCGNCSSSNGKPSGCKSNGGCTTGGCNRLNVFDWLISMPISNEDDTFNIIEVSFKNGSRKDYFKNTSNYIFEKGDWVTVEGVYGYDVGNISLVGELVKLQLKKRKLNENSDLVKKVFHPSKPFEIESYLVQKELEKKVLATSRAIAIDLNLKMKLSEVEIQADGKKATFFYTNDGYVDFRELIKRYAREFRFKIEMKQIGIRQEAAKIGGIGSCGRELCCSTWLTDFKNVNSGVTRYQNVSFNQDKITGQCGKLKCCLNFELDTYLDALQYFPNVDSIQTIDGYANLVKKEILKNTMIFSLPNRRFVSLSIDKVLEYSQINKSGRPVDLTEQKENKTSNFVDGGGQISLKSLNQKDSKYRSNKPGFKSPQQYKDSNPKDPNYTTGDASSKTTTDFKPKRRFDNPNQASKNNVAGDASSKTTTDFKPKRRFDNPNQASKNNVANETKSQSPSRDYQKNRTDFKRPFPPKNSNPENQTKN